MNPIPSDFYRTLMLAPIAGVTDRATRAIARELGCPLLFSELISATGISVRNRGSQTMLASCRDEHPLVIQLFGNDPQRFAEATKIVANLDPDGIDLNLGCPAKSIVKHGSGIGLTRDLRRMTQVIGAIRRNTALPFSVKIRAGWTHKDLNFLDVARIAQEEGVDGVTLHARTYAMGFSGEAYWPWITELKTVVRIPVIGNGDVKDGPSAAQMLTETGCDGVMVGRASYGNPWIFDQIQRYLETGETPPPPSLHARIDILIRHLRYIVEDKGEIRGVREMRKQIGWYLKGFPTVKDLRQIVNRLEKLEDVVSTLQSWAKSLPSDLIPLHRDARVTFLDGGRFTLNDGEDIQQVGDFQ